MPRVALALAALLLGCHVTPAPQTPPAPTAPVVIGEVLATYPQSPEAFTEGLELYEGRLYESGGLLRHSTLRVIALETGVVEQLHMLDADLYAEGITVFRDRVYQMTYQAHRCFVYDPRTLEVLREQRYEGEAWGLTHDEASLILSDGTPVLRWLDPETLTVERTLEVVDGDAPVERLNELEMVEGELFANVWMTDRIARIDLASGRVTGWLDLAFLRARLGITEPQAVLNGIAYDTSSRRLFVTGKLWPELYELRLPPQPGG